jgi:hypothetical protein
MYELPTLTTRPNRSKPKIISCCANASDFLKTITADTTAYHLPAIVAADSDIPSGPLLLKLIISRAHVDTRATVSFLRTSLTVLDEKMVELDSDVVAFNSYVKAEVKALNQRNQPTSDLLINLIKGYKKAEDDEGDI